MQTTQPNPALPRPLSKPARLLVGVVAAAVGLSTLAIFGLGFMAAAKPLWFLIGFEIVVLVASVFGLLIAAGRYQSAPAIGVMCTAGTYFTGAVLGWLSVRSVPFTELPNLAESQGRVMMLWMLGRIGAAGLLALVAAATVLLRNPRSMNHLVWAGASGLPLAFVGAMAYIGRGWFGETVSSMPGWLAGSIGALLAVVAGALFCIAAHNVIRAFEMGRPEARRG